VIVIGRRLNRPGMPAAAEAPAETAADVIRAAGSARGGDRGARRPER
jgi:hypothetical protein